MEETAPTRDVEYQRGLREAAYRGVDYGIALLEGEAGQRPQVPIALIAQARLAARQGISLEMVMKRFLGAKTLLDHFMLEEAAAMGALDPALLQSALAAHGNAFDRLFATIIEEYQREERSCRRSPGDRQLVQVRRLLAGELIDLSSLDYDLNRYHLGLVVGSPEARELIRLLAAETDSRPLIVRADEAETWAWLGSKEPLDPATVGRLATRSCTDAAPIAMGEPAQGCSGWRLTHRQAQAAFFTQVPGAAFTRFAEVAMVIGATESPLLSVSLPELYLAPLQKERDGGKDLCATLRAYFSADRNISSAAAALKVSRQTVTSRLRHVETHFGLPLTICGDAVAAALRMEELGDLQKPRDPAS